MKVAVIVATVLLAVTGSARAQDVADTRIATVIVGPSGYLRLQTAADVTQSVLFAQGERITSVILSNPGAFVVTVAGTGDGLALRAAGPGAFGVMSVRTTLRSYEFELMSGPASGAPAVVRVTEQKFASQPSAVMASSPDPAHRHEYQLAGSRALRPAAMSDDEVRTYIEWPRDQAIPATFAIGPTGDEQMVDGYMRGGIYTIDRVYETLIFRIDKQSAKASRLGKDGGHD